MPFQVSSTAPGSPATTMQDMRAWLSSLGVFKHTASVAKKAVHGEHDLVNAMQHRLREFLQMFDKRQQDVMPGTASGDQVKSLMSA